MKNEALTIVEQTKLESCEQVIIQGKESFIAVGSALETIRDERLYRIEFKSFSEYCEKKWGFGGSEGHRKILHARVAKQVKDAVKTRKPSKQGSKSVGHVPHSVEINERQARALAKIPEDRRMASLKKVAKLVKGKGPLKKITAKAIEMAAKPPSKNYFAHERKPVDLGVYSSGPSKNGNGHVPTAIKTDWTVALKDLVAIRLAFWTASTTSKVETEIAEFIREHVL